jgi:hypothetical protein
MSKAMSREEIDAYVIEAVTLFPDVQIDQAVVNDPVLAQRLHDISREIEPLLSLTIKTMLGKFQSKASLSLLEIGLAVLAPRIDRHVKPSIPMVSAMFAVMASSLIGMHYVSERNLQPGADVDGDDYEQFILDSMYEAVPFVVNMPKEEFLEALLALLKSHTAHINKTNGETA